MNYHNLTIEERSCIRKYYVDGLSYREIARLIGRNVSTVPREIRRNCTHMYDIPTYYPHTAQKKYLLRRSYCHRGMFRSQEIIDYTDGIYLEFGADTKIEGIGQTEKVKDIRKRAIQAGLKLVDCPIRHLGTEKAQEIYFAIEEFLRGKGVEILFFVYFCRQNVETL